LELDIRYINTGENLIACCGLDCATCDARIATIKNDDNLRKQTAEKWQKQYNSPEILPEMINCTGSCQEGVKLGHCIMCEIRKCVNLKGYKTCGECSEMISCQLVLPVHKFVPEAIINLRSLN
jgi:hypothetical protein